MRTALTPTFALLCLGLAAACTGGNNDAAPAANPSAPATAASPSVVTPATAAATPAAAVGPDGPTSIEIPADLSAAVAAADAKKGEALFASKGCVACHKTDATKLVGPGLAGVSTRRSEAWIARMMLKPEVMVKDDPVAKQLFGTYMTPMANQSVDPKTELPHLIAFLKTKS